MNQRFPTVTRRFVSVRANFRCEYCRKPDAVANFTFHKELVEAGIYP